MNLFSKTPENKLIEINLPWVEKYRPYKLEQLILDTTIKHKIEYFIDNKILPNIIITGDPGTGKTSTVMLLAKELYRDNYVDNVLELNASDDRGLHVINTIIIPFCKKKMTNYSSNNNSNYPTFKLIILDEADSVTPKAQQLLSILLSNFNYNTRIIFICNTISQIIESIQSKCMIIKYPKINPNDAFNKLQEICIEENIQYTTESINLLISNTENDLRLLINYLECIFYTYGKLSFESIEKITHKPKYYYIRDMIDNCIKKNYSLVITIVLDMIKKGYTSNDILLTLMKYIFDDSTNMNISKHDKNNIYDIISRQYMKINNNLDTNLQLIGCITSVYNYVVNCEYI
jgi:replication factor C subunit 2/4